jgi:phosphonate transport system substrate-binding protein
MDSGNISDKQAKRIYSVGYMKNLFNEVDINDAKAAIKVWINQLVKSSHYEDQYTLQVKIYNQFEDLNKGIKNDSLAIVALNTIDFINNGEKIGLEPVLAPSTKGDIFEQYYILVRKDARYKNLIDLRGANVGVLTGTNSAVPGYWLDVTLAKNNIPGRANFFKNISTSNKESQLILNLFFSRLDACVVSKQSFSLMKELNPQIGEKIISIQTSPNYLQGVVCFTKKFMNQSDRNLFYTNAIHIHETISGSQILSLVKVDKLESFKNEYLNSLKDLIKEYNYLVKAKKIKIDESN